MQKEFWLEKWQSNEIGFHQNDINPLLEKYFSDLGLAENSRIFVPLCGKSNDMIWLLSLGYQVVGVELSEDAIKQFFTALDVQPKISTNQSLKCYSAHNVDILVGDYFKLNHEVLGRVDAIYDRACLVALPLEMRIEYTEHLLEICDIAPQLLITFEYDQNLQAGPPFSISKDEVNQHYAKHYHVSLQDSVNVAGGLKGGCQAAEQVWLLT